MKLICVNAWGGQRLSELLSFIQDQDADVYCFQEVFHSTIGEQPSPKGFCYNLFVRLKESLPDHVAYFSEMDNKFSWLEPVTDIGYGQAIFVRKSINVDDGGDVFVYGERDMPYEKPELMGRSLQWIRINTSRGPLYIATVHGIITPKDCFGQLDWRYKVDHPLREDQTKRIRAFMKGKRCILCGDFNTWPDTNAMRTIGEGQRDLIAENNIMNTREKISSLYPEVSDYMFVPRDLIVKHFAVLKDKVSDHLPLVLEFEP